MITFECSMCHNRCPFEDFQVPMSASVVRVFQEGREPRMERGEPGTYTHPNCSKCRALLESHGIPQGDPYGAVVTDRWLSADGTIIPPPHMRGPRGEV